MLLIGGTDREGNKSDQIIEYDFKTGQSNVLLVMKRKRSSCCVVYGGNMLVVIGGVIDSQLVSGFNFVSNSWKKLPCTTAPRCFASAVLVNNLKF
jgi:hypothetical protein